MVDDVWDSWWHIAHLMEVAQGWYSYIKAGTWPDCDMIPLGRISIRGERGSERMSRLSPDEQYLLMTFFCLFRSPLMFGGDLPGNDAFTLSLLTNREVLRMHRESSNVRQLYRKDNKIALTSENTATGERYLALFNMDGHSTQNLAVNLAELGLQRDCRATELWQNQTLTFSDSIHSNLRPHAAVLYKIQPAENP